MFLSIINGVYIVYVSRNMLPGYLSYTMEYVLKRILPYRNFFNYSHASNASNGKKDCFNYSSIVPLNCVNK